MPRPISILLAAFLLLGIVYAATVPLFEAPDEQWHYAFVQHLAQGQGLPEQTLPLKHLARQEGSQPPLYYSLAAALTFWINTSDYPAIIWENPHYGFDVPGIVNDNKNLFIHSAVENFPYQNTPLAIHLARLVSLVMGAVAVYFTYRLTLLLPPLTTPTLTTARATAAAALIAFTPQFLFVSGAVSNDSTVVALCAIALFLLVRGFKVAPNLPRCHSRRHRLWSLCTHQSKWTRDASARHRRLYLLESPHHSPGRSSSTLGLLISFGVTAGWWYVRNLALYGEVTGTTRMLDIFGRAPESAHH